MAYAAVSPRPNSHPFQEREIRFNTQEPVKVGRSVAKAKPSSSNLIFDCKVLSRNHARLWYENGKFFLQDTKSSNGTYVNNVRLSTSGEESSPIEVKSGSLLQFGVDVVENSKKVTHGCIYAQIILFHPDGREAVGSSEESGLSVIQQQEQNNKVSPKEMWQLSQFLLEALHREQMLELKLATLQRMIGNGESATDDTWQGFIHEDKLLSRLDILENQLEVMGKEMGDEDKRQELIKLQDDKQSYESEAKDMIRKTLQEKVDAMQKLSDIERLLSNSEDEYSHLKTLYDSTQTELKELMDKHKGALEQITKLQGQVDDAAERHGVLESKSKEEKNELRTQLDNAEKRGSSLAVKVETLEVECDITRKQLDAMRAKLEKQQAVNAQQSLENSDKETSKDTDSLTGDSPSVNDVTVIPNGPVHAQDGTDAEDGTEISSEAMPYSDANGPRKSEGDIDTTVMEGRIEKLSTDPFEKPSPTGSDIVALEKDIQEKCSLIDVLEAQLEDSRQELMEAKNQVTRLSDQIETMQKEQLEKAPRWKESVDSGLGPAASHPEVVEQRMSGNFDIKRDLNGLLQDQNNEASDVLARQFDVITEIQDNLLDIKEAISFAFLPTSSLDVESPVDSGKTPEPGHNGFSNLHLPCGGSLEDQIELHGRALTSCSIDIKKLKDSLHRPLDLVTIPGRISVKERPESKTEEPTRTTVEGSSESRGEYCQLEDELDLTQEEIKTLKFHIEQLRDQLLEEQRMSRTYQEIVASLENQLSETKRNLELEKIDNEYEHQSLESARNVAMEMQKKAAEKSELAGREKVQLSASQDENETLRLRVKLLDAEIKKLRQDHSLLCNEKSRLTEDFSELKARSVKHLELCKQEKLQLQEQIDFHKRFKGISSVEVTELEEQLHRAEKEISELKSDQRSTVSSFNQQKSQLIQLVLAMLILIVAFGAAFMLDIVSISPGDSPIYDKSTWTSLWENILW